MTIEHECAFGVIKQVLRANSKSVRQEPIIAIKKNQVATRVESYTFVACGNALRAIGAVIESIPLRASFLKVNVRRRDEPQNSYRTARQLGTHPRVFDRWKKNSAERSAQFPS